MVTVNTPAFAESVTEGDVRWEKGKQLPEILSTVAAALDSSGMACSSLVDSLLCAFQSVTNEVVNCSSPKG